MPQERRGWPTTIGSAVLAGGFFYLAMTVVYRFVLGDSWDWGRAAGAAIAVTMVWVGVGAATRRGWVPPSQRRPNPDRAP